MPTSYVFHKLFDFEVYIFRGIREKCPTFIRHITITITKINFHNIKLSSLIYLQVLCCILKKFIPIKFNPLPNTSWSTMPFSHRKAIKHPCNKFLNFLFQFYKFKFFINLTISSLKSSLFNANSIFAVSHK